MVKNQRRMWTNILFTNLLLFITVNIVVSQDIPKVSGKNRLIVLGDHQYERELYKEAIDYYQHALRFYPENKKLLIRLGDSHRELGQLKKAGLYYHEAIRLSEEVPAEVYLSYGEVLLMTEKKDEANQYFKKYSVINNDDKKVSNRLKALEMYDHFFKDSSAYIVQLMDINSQQSDFSPAYYREGLLFLSSQGNIGILKRFDRRSYNSYLNVYLAETSGKDYKVSSFDPLRNKYHEGPMVFFNDYQEAYITKNDDTDKDSVVRLKISHMKVGHEGSKMAEETELPFNSDNYSVGHPATTADGKTLIFTSDMPGGFGGTDLYASKLVDGKWQKPENLGGQINTPGDEMFPYLARGGQLYFASDGHIGLGGLDIFMVDFEKKSPVTNPGFPINSSYDDFGLIIDEGGQKGYFSSNRVGGTGSDDLYEFIISTIQITSTLLSKGTGENFKGNLRILDSSTGEEIPFQWDGEKVVFDGFPNRDYVLEGREDGYEPISIPFSTHNASNDNGTSQVALEFERIPAKPIERYVDGITIRNHGVETHFTSIGGEWSISEIPPDKWAKHNTFEVGEWITTSPPLFDFNGVQLREKAKEELDRLYRLISKNGLPGLHIIGYADSRGPTNYNQRLSHKRAETVKKYLVQKGYKSSIIKTEGRGETQLTNHCRDGVACSEEEHQANRRVEFFLNNLEFEWNLKSPK